MVTRAFWVVGGIAFVVVTILTAMRGGGFESVISGLVVGAVAGGLTEFGLRKVRGEL